MKFLGIDYGAKRIGIAVSDERGTLAFPKIILENKKDTFEKIKNILEEEKIKELVIGESLNFAGEPNAIAPAISAFTIKLGKLNLPIHKEKEFFTSVEARKLQGSKDKVDAGAATLILQRYLDRINLL